MLTAIIEVLKLKETDNGTIAASSCRYSTKAGGNVAIRWDALRKPKGWKSLGDVLYGELEEEWTSEPASTAPTALGDGKYQFYDDSQAHLGGMLLTVILPEGFTVNDFTEMIPPPQAAKVHKGKLALLWKLGNEQERVIWKQKKEPGFNVVEEAEKLNNQIAITATAPAEVSTIAILNGHNDDQADESDNGDTIDQVDDETYQPVKPAPSGPAGWLLESVRQMPFMGYALAVVGVVAAAALSVGFFFGNALFPLFGGVAVLGGMFLLRLFAALKPLNEPIRVSLPLQVLIWAFVGAVITMLVLGVIKIGVTMFDSTRKAAAKEVNTIDPPASTDPWIGAKVFLKPGSEPRIDGTVIDPRRVPFPSIVEEVNGDMLRLGPAWVRKDDVMLTQAALSYFNDKIKGYPTNQSWRRGRGIISMDMGAIDDAIDDFSKAIKLSPIESVGYGLRGLAFGIKGEFDNAINDFSKAITLDPGVAMYYVNRGISWAEIGELDKALADYSNAISIDNLLVPAHIGRGNVMLLLCDYDESIRDLTNVIKLDPKCGVAYASRGSARAAKGDFELALDDFNEGLRLDPQSFEVLRCISWFRATCPDERYRRGSEAVGYATKACERVSWKTWRHFDMLAAASAEAGDFSNAVEWAEQALELAPEKLKPSVNERLKLYRLDKPYRDESKNSSE